MDQMIVVAAVAEGSAVEDKTEPVTNGTDHILPPGYSAHILPYA
jgi:hypothetical protein